MQKKQLGLRLAAIENQIQQCLSTLSKDDPELPIQLWDCCCDHGFLGRNFINNKQLQAIHFVDCIPSIIEQLNQKLLRLPNIIQAEKIHTHVSSAGDIHLTDNTHHIVVLAGIGGITLIELLESLYNNHQSHSGHILFALCPNHHSYAVRQFLQQKNFSLIHEEFIHENGKFHELILVKLGSHQLTTTQRLLPISSTGNFWQAQAHLQAQYLAQLLQHYQRQLRHSQPQYSAAILSTINDYQAIQQQVYG